MASLAHAVELMADVGLRPGEVVALHVHVHVHVPHVDLCARRIRIRRTETIDIHDPPTFGEPKHGERRERKIPVIRL